MIRLLLVDDQALFRQGLASLLSLEEDLEVIGQANHGREAIALTEELQPDVILMDVRMPICDGVVATREIHQRYPWIRILVLTTFDEDEYIWQSLQAGALGYLLKSTPSGQIATAIRTIDQGYSQLGPTIAPKVFAQLNPIASTQISYPYLLSERELEVLQLLDQGKNNREIAAALHLSEGTIPADYRVASTTSRHERQLRKYVYTVCHAGKSQGLARHRIPSHRTRENSAIESPTCRLDADDHPVMVLESYH